MRALTHPLGQSRAEREGQVGYCGEEANVGITYGMSVKAITVSDKVFMRKQEKTCGWS